MKHHKSNNSVSNVLKQSFSASLPTWFGPWLRNPDGPEEPDGGLIVFTRSTASWAAPKGREVIYTCKREEIMSLWELFLLPSLTLTDTFIITMNPSVRKPKTMQDHAIFCQCRPTRPVITVYEHTQVSNVVVSSSEGLKQKKKRKVRRHVQQLFSQEWLLKRPKRIAGLLEVTNICC